MTAQRVENSEKTPLQKAIGLAMWAPGVAWLTSVMSTMMVVQRFVPADRIEWLTRFYTRGQIVVSGSRLRYVVHPAVDPERVYMFAQNHVNMLDHCTCYAGTPHFKQGIELAKHFEVPFYGWFMRQRGTIPVYRDGKEGVRKLVEGVRAEVARGHSILVFPEGTRTLNGRVGKFQMGALRVAHSLGLPIVPVAVTGMFEVMRKGEPYINPGHIVTVYFEEPIETANVSEAELPALVESVQRAVAARVDAYYAAREQREPVPQSRLPHGAGSREEPQATRES
jgi:1-acyl-sn-glycerol-3-phosphate acyltransferase